MTEPMDQRLVARKEFAAGITTVRQQGGLLTALDFEPADLPSLIQVAELISRSTIVPKIYQGDPNTTLMVLWKGRERGLSVMQSVELIYPFHSSKGPQVSYAADLLYGLVQRSGECEYFMLKDSTPTSATYETIRRGNPAPTSLTYTTEQAKLAGLLSKENWQKNPAEMCRAAAKRNLCRAVYGDIIAGLYTREELEELAAIDITPEPPSAPGARTAALVERLKAGRQPDPIANAMAVAQEAEQAEIVVDAEPQYDRPAAIADLKATLKRLAPRGAGALFQREFGRPWAEVDKLTDEELAAGLERLKGQGPTLTRVERVEDDTRSTAATIRQAADANGLSEERLRVICKGEPEEVPDSPEIIEEILDRIRKETA